AALARGALQPGARVPEVRRSKPGGPRGANGRQPESRARISGAREPDRRAVSYSEPLGGGSPSAPPSTGAASLGMACFSDSHAPRSINRQRSLQNGRYGELAQSISRRQVGHLTPLGLIRCNSSG